MRIARDALLDAERLDSRRTAWYPVRENKSYILDFQCEIVDFHVNRRVELRREFK